MSKRFRFDAEWLLSSSDSPEEKACFAEIGLWSGDRCLTECDDRFVKRTRTAAALSGYRLAEWLAWNWWRLRWEPRRDGEAWACAHKMASIGGGYVWPNITIIPDGQRIVLSAEPTSPNPLEPVRYISNLEVTASASEFENAVDDLLGQIQQQLRLEGVAETNFDRIWNAVREERADADTSLWRRFEASLGFDPDEGDEAVIERMMADAGDLGKEGVGELASASNTGGVLSAEELNDLARQFGADCRPADMASLPRSVVLKLPRYAEPPWKRGAAAAKALREQEKLGDDPLDNAKLAQLAGVSDSALGNDVRSTIAFTLNESNRAGRMVLRSSRETGRRFDLARLLGDCLASGVTEKFRPATESKTFRQKMQKAFARELLCPFDALEQHLDSGYSDEATEDAARYFNVSPLTVQASLANHGRIPRTMVETGWAA